MPKIAASDGTKLYVEESGTGTRSCLCTNMRRTIAPGSRRCGTSRARTAASPTANAATRLGRAGRPRQIYASLFQRRCDRGHGCAQDRQGARGRPFDGRVDGPARGHPTCPPLHLGDGRRLRLRLERRSEGRGGVARRLARNRQNVRREHDGGFGCEIRRRRDTAGAQEQGPARLRGVRQDAERAFAARPFADHGQPASQTSDLVGHGGRSEKVCAAASRSSSATRTTGVSTPVCSYAAPRRPPASSWCRAPAIR